MEKRTSYFSDSKWEPIVGYCRAVRIGNIIEVSGTCAIDSEGNPFAPGNAYLQTKKIMEIITNAIEKLGGNISDVVRTRMYVTNIQDWQDVGKAHGETFQSIRPVTTMLEVSKLISAEFLVEIEATAIIA